MNKTIIDQFRLLIEQIQAEYLNAQMENNPKEISTHKFRLQTIQKILKIIQNLDFEITSSDDLVGIPGIGAGTISRIKEILQTGKLSEIEKKYTKKKQSRIDSIQELTKVINVGESIAKKLVLKYGITNISDLKKAIKNKTINVSPAIQMGLKYYGVVQGSIPRSETSQIEKYLRIQAMEIDPMLEIMICGSYRRGKATSGDIDVLLYNPKIKTPSLMAKSKPYLKIFVQKLTEEKFLLDNMTDKDFNRKYMGFCKYKLNPVRRIDIRYIPYDSLPTAMLYFTGPYELNTLMRIQAKKRHMILNEYGLYKINSNSDSDDKTLIKTKSEAEVFNVLGMKYLTPEEREEFSSGKIKKNK